jgi:hypothetical protein
MSLLDKIFNRKAKTIEETQPLPSVQQAPVIPDIPAAQHYDDPTAVFTATTNPHEFFAAYNQAISDAEHAGQFAAAETLRANKMTNQREFIDRYAQQTQTNIANFTPEQQANAVVKAIDTVRRYNSEMDIDVRAFLAQKKRELIARISD